MSARTRHYSRIFLNVEGHHGLAAVLAEVKDGDDSADYLDFSATFEISDCNRTVSLDFGVYGGTSTQENRDELRADLVNAREKARRLVAELNEFVGALDTALDGVEQDLDKRDRKAKKSKKSKAKKTSKKG